MKNALMGLFWFGCALAWGFTHKHMVWVSWDCLVGWMFNGLGFYRIVKLHKEPL